MKRALLLSLFVAVTAWSAFARAAPSGPSAYAESLLAAAQAKHLSSRVEWQRLGHWHRGLFGGYESLAHGDAFFLAKDGKTDPDAELRATLLAFFESAPTKKDSEQALCRFPARFLFLNAELSFDLTKLPNVECRGFREFMQLLRPDSVTLVFSAYYLNNPASTFGHTFLRVNKAGRRGPEHNELLDYGVDYGARVDTGNPVLYAIKGLFGLFAGDFRKVPYYFKVREYNDYESRDLWEYELALSPDEVRMFAAHLWELGSTYFTYYYLSQNCSYHVLDALEAASPRLHLLDHVGWPVIPADTVRALFDNPGLVRAIRYRPSAETIFRKRLHELTDEEAHALAVVVGNPSAPFPAHFTQDQRVRVLDSALDLEDSRYARELLKAEPERDAVLGEQKQRLLERRAEEGVPSEELSYPPPVRRMPHLGHASHRFGLGSGYSNDRRFYDTLKFRVTLHDIADPAQGYPETAGMEFLPVTLRYYVERPKVTLEDAGFLRILSLSPWDKFRMPMSWSAYLGTTRIRDGGCRDCLAGQIEAGGGGSVSFFEHGALFYALGDAQILGLSPIRGGIAKIPLRAGVGPAGGLRLRFTDDFLAVFQANWLYLPVQTPRSTWSADATLRLQYVKNFAFGVEGRIQPNDESVQGVSYLYF